ncbi:MAG: hypothetical protein ABH867_02025 [Patescibacteria group bacterium]|nr:hypothetical protein [Patescibacteria group bacterium]
MIVYDFFAQDFARDNSPGDNGPSLSLTINPSEAITSLPPFSFNTFAIWGAV